MQKIVFDKQFFNICDTLECGQIFRFKPFKQGFLVFTLNKCAYCYESGENTIIECLEGDEEYFYNFFDLQRDYSLINNQALNEHIDILSLSANLGKGIRILNQDCVEMLFSFIVSQNNNIPRIKGIIEKLCFQFGEKKQFKGEEYYSFPSIEKMAEKDVSFFQSIGLGYRAEYVRRLAVDIKNGLNVYNFTKLDTLSLKNKLTSLYGVGRKVCDCVSLFGFHRSDSFPVDTWIEKVYKENFNGQLSDREKIAEWFVSKFKENAGYYQQYLFYYKRSLEKKNNLIKT